MIPVGDLTTWKNRLAMASDAELASLDQQIGPTHALRALVSNEVTGRARQRAGIGAEFTPTPVQVPGQTPPAPAIDVAIPPAMTAAPAPAPLAVPPAPAIAAPVPPVPQAIAPAQPAMTPVQVPSFYNQGDQQLVRDTVQTMDRMGNVAPQVIGDYRRAASDVLTEYGGYASDVLTGWGDATRETIDAWRPRLSSAFNEVVTDIGNAARSGYDLARQTGYQEPAGNSMLAAQTGGTTSTTTPGMMGAQIGPQATPPVQIAVPSPVSTAQAAPGEPPPPSPPSPLSQVTAAPAVKRKPVIPVVPPPQQTTKSANQQTGVSAAEALNRFYADQMSQGRIPGSPATVEDARNMASMGGFKGAWR